MSAMAKHTDDKSSPPVKTIWGCNIELLQEYGGVSDDELCAGVEITRQTLWAYKNIKTREPRSKNQQRFAIFFTKKFGFEITPADVFKYLIDPEVFFSKKRTPQSFVMDGRSRVGKDWGCWPRVQLWLEYQRKLKELDKIPTSWVRYL